ncbi:MAG: TIGR00730 family Rossman fold protein [Hyphomicrobiales bacterium]|nr:TIGR00730 family Rossman fold protein [Hyphomicrobiales bacterium]MDE2018563.1 TIGR00730 family Rossman fold protein [Hyphomicrobiales bacterium]
MTSSSALRRICVFCGSSPGRDPRHAEAARAFGGEIARRGLGLVYGGGAVGLMGIVADAALAGGAEVVGIIPRALARREVAHRGLADLRVVETMHARKAAMAELADAFVALPGGIGTFEELFEVWTWAQLGDHAKPVGLLDVAGFYRPLLAFLDGVVEAGFLREAHRSLAIVETDGGRLIDRLAAYEAKSIAKWLTAPDDR